MDPEQHSSISEQGTANTFNWPVVKKIALGIIGVFGTIIVLLIILASAGNPTYSTRHCNTYDFSLLGREAHARGAISYDVRRISDIKQIGLALQLYADDHGHYPRITIGTDLVRWNELSDFLVPDYISEVPSDPCFEKNPEYQYTYKSSVSGDHYVLRVILKDEEYLQSIINEQDLDGDVLGVWCGTEGHEREYCFFEKIASVQVQDSNTYTDDKYGFKFQYPSTWQTMNTNELDTWRQSNANRRFNTAFFRVTEPESSNKLPKSIDISVHTFPVTVHQGSGDPVGITYDSFDDLAAGANMLGDRIRDIGGFRVLLSNGHTGECAPYMWVDIESGRYIEFSMTGINYCYTDYMSILESLAKLEARDELFSVKQIKNWTTNNSYFNGFEFQYPEGWETGNGDTDGAGAFWVNPSLTQEQKQVAYPVVMMIYHSYAPDDFEINEYELIDSVYINGLSENVLVPVYKSKVNDELIYRISPELNIGINSILFRNLGQAFIDEFLSRMKRVDTSTGDD